MNADAQKSARFTVPEYNLDEDQFLSILHGKLSLGRLNQEWAAVYLLENAPYADIVNLMGYKLLVDNWPVWRMKVTMDSRRRGLDFFTNWLINVHPELCGRSSDE